MTRNVGTLERVIRALIGLGLISVVFVSPRTQWGWISLILLATAVIGWCPPYAALGINTCRSRPKGKGQ